MRKGVENKEKKKQGKTRYGNRELMYKKEWEKKRKR